MSTTPHKWISLHTRHNDMYTEAGGFSPDGGFDGEVVGTEVFAYRSLGLG